MGIFQNKEGWISYDKPHFAIWPVYGNAKLEIFAYEGDRKL